MQYHIGDLRIIAKIFCGLITVCFFLLKPDISSAQVKGLCVNCHTMHSSQDGASTVPRNQLLNNDCVGCHTNSVDDSTIVNLGGYGVPIVFNTGGYPGGNPFAGAPNAPLAGGNFYFVSNPGPNQQNYGHNVLGISLDDTNYDFAPGMTAGASCLPSCHSDLTYDQPDRKTTPGGVDKNGCEGCHLATFHHKPEVADLSYRFLSGHGEVVTHVDGIEDPDWEQSVSDIDHNVYKRQSADIDFNPITIGRWCAGCHGTFHAMGVNDPLFNVPNGGDKNSGTEGDGYTSRYSGTAWLRHPTNVNLPMDATFGGEYYNLNGQPYNPLVPVAQDLYGGFTNTIEAGDQVMCLSCHRAHASDQPYALRFNYNNMIAHKAVSPDPDPDGDGRYDGCFFCHNTKWS